MTIELDHLFICSQVNAPEMEQLIEIGLIEGRSNVHPGQGTANRCIFFENFMLELLFAVSEKELFSPIIQPTRLKERCNYQTTGYSPFGVAFRCTEPNTDLALATWAYQPPYLPENLQIDIAEDTTPKEPLLFVVPFKKAQNRSVNHPAGMKQVTKVEITIPTESFSEAVNAINNCQEAIKFISGRDNLVIIECDRFTQQQEHVFRPDLPLIFRW